MKELHFIASPASYVLCPVVGHFKIRSGHLLTNNKITTNGVRIANSDGWRFVLFFFLSVRLSLSLTPSLVNAAASAMIFLLRERLAAMINNSNSTHSLSNPNITAAELVSCLLMLTLSWPWDHYYASTFHDFTHATLAILINSNSLFH